MTFGELWKHVARVFGNWIAQDPPSVIKPEYLLAAVAVGIRLVFVWFYLSEPIVTEVTRAGWTLGRSGYIGDPFLIPTGPTVHVSPMYPAILGLLYRVVGDVRPALDLARTLHVLLLGAVIAALPWGAKAIGLGRKSGLLAAVLFVPVGVPAFASVEIQGDHETLLTFAWFYFLFVGTIAVRLSRVSCALWPWLLLGIAWGLGAHTSPLLLTALTLVTLVLLWQKAPDGRKLPFRSAVAMAAGAVIAVTPWTIRNYRQTGQLMLIRGNFGLELDVSNSDGATFDMRENYDPGSMKFHPYSNSAAALRLSMIGEAAFYRERGAVAKHWIATHPGQFAKLTLQRTVAFFLPSYGMKFHASFYLFVACFGVLGLFILFRRQPWLGYMLSAAVLGFSSPYFVLQTHERYSYPILWLTTLVSCWCLLTLFGAERGARR